MHIGRKIVKFEIFPLPPNIHSEKINFKIFKNALKGNKLSKL